MDRVIVYPGQIPLDTDFLKTQRSKMIGLGFLADTVLGSAVLFDGLTCQPTTPASMSVQILPGTVYSAQPTDPIPFGSLGSDPFRQTVKQGILRDTATLTLVAPVTTGHAINYLVQAAFSEVEAQPVVLPYYNSANPAQPYSGPENSGVAQYTERRGQLLVGAKAGLSAISGSQVTPAPDPGHVGLYVITVAYGATDVSSGNITKIQTAPFLPAKLPEIPSGVRDGRWIYAQDTGPVNTIEVEVTPAPTIYRAGMGLRVKIAHANTGPATVNVNGIGPVSLRRADGNNLQEGDLYVGMVADVVHDGNRFQLANSTGLVTLRSIGEGEVDIYQGKISGVHAIRSLVAGSNITLSLVESPADSGEYAISIAASPGDPGVDPIAIVNIGSAIQLYKGLNGPNHEIRTIHGEGLLTAALGGAGNNEVRVKMADADGARLLMRAPNSSGPPAFVKISETPNQANLALTDKVLIERNATGNVENATIAAIRGNSQSLWEIVQQVQIGAPVNILNLLFEADKYSELKLTIEDLNCSPWGGMEICVMSDDTIITRRPGLSDGSNGTGGRITGQVEWLLCNLNQRLVYELSSRLVDVSDQNGAGTQTPPLTVWPLVFEAIGGGNGTSRGIHAAAGGTPPNKIRIRNMAWSSLYNNTGTPQNMIGGRVTLYGLKRSHQ